MKRLLLPAMSVALLAAGCVGPDPELQTRAVSEFQVGHVTEAKVLFQQALDRYPCDPEALYYMGRIAHAQGAYEDAVYYFQCCLDADPAYADAYGWLARSEQAAGSAGRLLRFIP